MPHHDTTEAGARLPPPAADDRTPGPRQPAESDVPTGGAGRRDFFLTIALAATLGCRGSPPPGPPARSATPAPPPEPADLSQDIRAIRAHVLKLEAPPSFVFSVRFRDVP